MPGLLRRKQSAAEAIGDRAAAADLDAEADREVDGHSANTDGRPEEGVKGFEMVAERISGIVEPGENPVVALIERPSAVADGHASHDLLDQLPLGGGRQCSGDFGIIENACDYQGLVAGAPRRLQRREIGKSGNLVDEAALAETAPEKDSGRRQEDEEGRRDVEVDKPALERSRPDEQGDKGCAHDRNLMALHAAE